MSLLENLRGTKWYGIEELPMNFDRAIQHSEGDYKLPSITIYLNDVSYIVVNKVLHPNHGLEYVAMLKFYKNLNDSRINLILNEYSESIVLGTYNKGKWNFSSYPFDITPFGSVDSVVYSKIK